VQVYEFKEVIIVILGSKPPQSVALPFVGEVHGPGYPAPMRPDI